MKNNTYVIGDTHGALKALIQLLERMHLQQTDRLIFIGDYVDGWSQSAQVIDYLMALEKNYVCIFIKGNHDAWCEDWLGKGITNEMWLKHGGKETIESYTGVSDEVKAAHLAFFGKMKLYYLDDTNRLFVHAGFSSMHGAAYEVYPTNYYWDRTLWEMAVCMDERIQKDSALFPKRLLKYNAIFIGHTPVSDLGSDVPLKKGNVWNVDTGAGFTGKLSALNIDTEQFYQSDNCTELYPLEKGRNK